MSLILDAKLRFADAVYSVERTPKAVRKWLQNPEVKLCTDGGEGWRQFSFGDLAILALMAKSIDFGLGVAEANDLALNVLDQSFGWQFHYTPPYALIASITHATLLVWRDNGRVAFERKPFWKGDFASANAFLVIQLEPVLRRAFDRAVESSARNLGDDGADA